MKLFGRDRNLAIGEKMMENCIEKNGDEIRQSKIQWKYVYRFACAAILTVIAAGFFLFFWYGFVCENNQTGHLLGLGNLTMEVLLYIALYGGIGRWLHAFKIGVERKASVMASQVLTALTTDVLEVFLSLAITGQFRFFHEFVQIYLILFLIQAVLLSFLTIPMINWYRKIFPPLQVLEIYGEHMNRLYEKINGVPYKYHISKILSYSEGEAVIQKEMETCDAVLINDLPAEEKNRLLKLCFGMNKRVYFVPKLSDVIVKGSEELNLFDTPLFLSRNHGIPLAERAVKRFFDVALSLMALVMLSPVFLITAIAIKLEDGGSVFYRQERCTFNGNRFWILKFRSMIEGAEKDGRPHPAGEHDDRITRVGRVIRACRVDELPQLLNIIRGEMSIVGPRPERVEHVKKYTEDIPEFVFRTKMKAGLTGMAQVYGKYNTTALDKLKFDMIYITNFSILLDLQIIFETLKILFQKESTEGFSEERVQEMQDGGKNDICCK